MLNHAKTEIDTFCLKPQNIREMSLYIKFEYYKIKINWNLGKSGSHIFCLSLLKELCGIIVIFLNTASFLEYYLEY